MVTVIEPRPLAMNQVSSTIRDRGNGGGRIRRHQLKYSNRYSPIKKVHLQHTTNTTVWSRTRQLFGHGTNVQRHDDTSNENFVSFKKTPTRFESFGRRKVASPLTCQRWSIPTNKRDGLASNAKPKHDFDENNNQSEESNLIDTDITLISMSYTMVPKANESIFNDSYSKFAANAMLTSTMIEEDTIKLEKRSKR